MSQTLYSIAMVAEALPRTVARDPAAGSAQARQIRTRNLDFFLQLKDKFGLSWQIVPARLPDLVKNQKAMQAMMQMKKIDIAELERAAQE